ncbi:hypothetical protein HJD18_11385 [Thermoleophilia bacterium SCSIO 60948]|nr:hypothetical protein HJD18_11385 [Thermoleophilia bacterium SCSIO 60948]
MFSIRKLALLFSALLLAVLVGCGGDDGGSSGGSSDEDPQEVLDAAFASDNTISSGVLDLSVDGSAEGDQGGSFSLSLSGPFQGDPDNPAALPQLDWDASVEAEGAGQSFNLDGGLIVTEDNAYVEYQDQAYEVGTDVFEQLKTQFESQQQAAGSAEGLSFEEAFVQGCSQSIEQQGGDPSACENIDLNSWLGELSNEGTEDIDGTETTHVSGDIDTEAMVNDLVELGTAVPSAGGAQPTDEQIQQVTDAISEAGFDVYVDGEDNIRQIDFTFGLDVSGIPEASASGVEGAELTFSAGVGEPNEEQTIEAPSDAAPIDELAQQFGGLGGLGALGGAGALGGSTGGSTSPDTEQLECLQNATTPEDQQACLLQ